ncbi:MAG: SHOCT domain-containing protein [Pseudonocardia sp.]
MSSREVVTMMWWYGPAAGGWGMAMAAVTSVLIWLLVAAAVAVLVHHLARQGTRAAPPRTAEALLAERFARGELDEPEYRARLDVLRERHPDRAG